MTHERTLTDIDRIAIFLAHMATKTADRDRVELFQNAVIETGGDWLAPEVEDEPDGVLIAVQLFGIRAHGWRAKDAVAAWVSEATKAVDHHAKVGAAELIVLRDLKDCSDEALRDAIETVRLHSQDQRAIAAARRVGMMFQTKGAAA